MLTLAQQLAPADKVALAWLCRMAAAGCAHENLSAWAAQLMLDARQLDQDAAGGAR